jgi:hypothetical protein
MKKVVTLCTLLAALCYLTAYASTPSQQNSAGKQKFSARRPAKAPSAASKKGVNSPYDFQVKKGQVDAAKVQHPAAANPDKSVEYANPLKAEYQEVLAEAAKIQANGGDVSALKQRASELYQAIYGSHQDAPPVDQGGEACADAVAITALPFQDCGTTTGHVNDYAGSCVGSGAPDVVYSLTLSAGVTATISLCGSSYDTGLHVWNGCPGPNGQEVGCNDDFCTGFTSCLTLTLAANTTYYIVVDGYGANSGPYVLNVTTDGQCHTETCPVPVPDNDDCANAVSVAAPIHVVGSTLGATPDPGAPSCGTSVDAPGVWYVVIGDGTTLTASLCNTITDYDSKIHVYTCGCDHLTCVTGNDDFCGLHSQVSWCSRAGEPYWILVDGYASHTGNFQLDMSSDGLACDGGARCPCWDATLEAPGSLTGSTIDEDGDCYEGCPDYAVQVTIPSDGLWNFSLCGSDYDTYLYVGTDCCLYDVCANDDNYCDGEATLQSSCCVEIPAGTYYVTILGFGCESGNFVLTVGPCVQVPPGETCADPIVIGGLPYADNGTTSGKSDDIDFQCEYDTPSGPDVVYSFTPAVDVDVNVSLCHSWYDTRLGIFDAATGALLCCNDDACDNPDYEGDDGYQSYIACCHLLANHSYCIVVDGYSGASGDYELVVTQGDCGGCVVECPAGAAQEGEECGTDINGGCNTEGLPTTPIECGETVCGTSYALNGTRDTDFYELVITQPTTVNWCAYAEFAAQVAIVSPGTLGCLDNIVYAIVYGDTPCQVTCASAECLQPGTYWLFVASVAYDGVPCSDYVAHVECTPCGGCNPTPYVQMSTTPIPQYYCADLCPETVTYISICGEPGQVLDPTRPPIVTITPGCSPTNTRCDRDCPPAQFIYDPAGWVWDGCWYGRVTGVTAGCVCICLEGFLGVEYNNDFTAVATDGEVALSWSTASETNNARFDVQRNGETVAQVPASGTTSGHGYTWTDHQVQNGTTYTYALVSVDVNGNREDLATTTATPSYGAAIVTEYALHQNYPNPFNPETNITFDLVEAGNVHLAVYNLMGQQVATVVNGEIASGRHTVNFNATNLPSGVYVYRLNVNGFVAEKKMMLMK